MELEVEGKNYTSLTLVPIHCFRCGKKTILISTRQENIYDEQTGKPIIRIEIDCPDKKHRGGIKPLFFQFIEISNSSK